ncbi:MAG: division/cell wall cluster transcriptional repressor MraZ [gamma proteobacterium endosymbiont of Lamellibrachia anaximandri]|nr:division/cell wall cluster transcriptional repressor MraZ [gamma proteobacterium endosymbiont of Lamellibrachia anaximandri]MBL3535093.1 division/cell wall cluster transcriptional repressor MraZ [gamma proteobacterium endosymbiont of Lamellibrachia anaximandri]MBL3598317.1 division/cell wall cluster transcriptional repressor MraZ [gamma proteobacterium endosymbiont of Lamellibrachia anaximandri]
MFRGVSKLNLDAKGRMAIPTRYRDGLVETCASQLVITVDKDRCLLIYPKPDWLVIEEQINDLSAFNESARNLQRLYIGHAQEIDMDGQGRILLPPELREFASLDKKVALVGQGNKFELWDEAAWSRKRDEWLNKIDEKGLELTAQLESISL